jgi:hypothetical protein
MRRIKPLYRHLCGLALIVFGGVWLFEPSEDPSQRVIMAQAIELNVPETAEMEHFDFEPQDLKGWKTIDGQWAVEEMPGAPTGGPYTDVDVSVRFQPISGREDASGGIVFRFADGRYYVVRANALENNVRLYYYDRSRHQLATAIVQPPALGRWHTLRVVVVGDQIQASLDGQRLLDHRDARFRAGQVGLWTKADSITAFDDFVVRGVAVGR